MVRLGILSSTDLLDLDLDSGRLGPISKNFASTASTVSASSLQILNGFMETTQAIFLAAVQSQIIALSYQSNSTSLQVATNLFGFIGVLLDVITAFLAFMASRIIQAQLRATADALNINKIERASPQHLREIKAVLNRFPESMVPSDFRHRVDARVPGDSADLEAGEDTAGGVDDHPHPLQSPQALSLVASFRKIQDVDLLSSFATTALIWGILDFLVSVLFLAASTQPRTVWIISVVVSVPFLAFIGLAAGLRIYMSAALNSGQTQGGFCSLSSKPFGNMIRFLSPSDIHALFSVSRWIHRLSVDSILAAHGISDPTLKSEVSFDGNFADADTQNPDPLTALRCQRILAKFPSLRAVGVEFQTITYDARFLPSGGMDEPLHSSFKALLDTIADLPLLESLRIATGWHFDSSYMLELFPSVTALNTPSQSTTTSLLKTPSKLYKNLFPRRNPVRTQRTPIAFFIDTPFLVLPSFYPQTMSILTSRSITALRLHMLIAPADWSTVLTEIVDAAPYLAELTVLGVRMPVPTLIERITPLRQLTLLTLDSAPDFLSAPSFRAIQPPPPTNAAVSTPQTRLVARISTAASLPLQHLTTLSARPEHLDALLLPPNPMPALTSLTLRVEILDLNSPGTGLLMHRIIPRLRETHTTLPLAFDVRANIAPEALMCRTLDIALSQGPAWDDAFGSIAHLRIRDYGEFSCAVLARWVTVFRGAKRISLSGLAQTSSARIMAEIRRTRPDVQTITVEDFTGDEDGGAARGTDAFLELPDDVLLIIFQHLGAELYALARSSRRLNLLALPVYLAKNGVPDPTARCEFRLVNHPTGGDVLSALASAVYITQAKHISCEFTSHGGNVSCYLHHIERLTRFIHGLSSVDAVSLSLVDLGNVDSEINALVRQRWRSTFSALLNVILEKSCGALTIRGAPYLKPDAASEPAWPADEATVELSALAQANSSIHTFSFHPPPNLSGAGISWVFSALLFSQVSVLSITLTSGLLLQIIAGQLPNLVDLEVISCPDSLDLKLIDLLNRLPALTRLSLPFKSDLHGNRPFVSDRRIPSLPNLRTLSAAAPFLLHFLLAEPALPLLETLEIRTSSVAALPAKWSLARVLNALKERGPKSAAPTVTLELTLAHRQFELWLRSGGFRALIGPEAAWMEAAAGVVRGLRLRWSTMFKVVDCERVLREILPHFPALEVLSVDDGTGRRGEVGGQDGVLAFIAATYPDLRTVVVNNVVVPVEGVDQ
ncbi:hypothetical protein C8R46DRAFT_1294170 [Mycena filopes]|nr:hypothetical protein C8R46DRAFT_1294170 [Mycena filopes]